ncbi:MAG TPA: PQQ-binding-like beta-propeller repeat protein [Polyangia bacterium]
MKLAHVLVLVAAGCATSHPAPPSLRAIALPDAPADGVFMDYLAYDRAHHRVWVPAGNTGKVDVVEVPSGVVAHVDGFATKEVERRGKKRIVGPSSATVGDGVVYVGNRGDSTVCAIDAASLHKGACATLASMPDGLAWVAATREVWVTTPRDQSITILDAATPGALAIKQTLHLPGEPEGYAVDEGRGLFYTNLEDKDRTLQIDVRSKETRATWLPACGEDGPKGLALDRAANFLFVACADKVKTLDAGHDGKELSALATGDGVDNIDYVGARHELYAGAGRAATLTVAAVDAQGKLTAAAVVPTSAGARNAVATDDGTAYLTDSRGGKILVVSARRP